MAIFTDWASILFSLRLEKMASQQRAEFSLLTSSPKRGLIRMLDCFKPSPSEQSF
jgi:hypothetical protein